MGALTSVGKKSKTVIFQHESHKLHIEFAVAAGQTVKRGQPVQLAANGTVQPWAKANLNHTIIGYCYNDAAAGEFVTVVMKAYMVILAINATAGALNAGPVTYQGYNSVNADLRDGLTGYNTFSAALAGNTEYHGWNLDQASAQYELIRVALT